MKILQTILLSSFLISVGGFVFAADCRACGECEERNKKRKEVSDKCKKECLEDNDKRKEKCVEQIREHLRSCISECDEQERNCNENNDDEDGYRVRCDYEPCRNQCRDMAGDAIEECKRGSYSDCNSLCAYTEERCPCGGCADRAPH